MIQIDGSFGEGGGQIIRTALSLALVTGRGFEIRNVRAGRSKPGLQPQHLACVRAGARVSDAEIAGDAVGSTWFRFAPRTAARAGDYRFDIGTAGASGLLLQTLWLPLALANGPSSVTVTGGTHVPHAPTLDYLEAVYGPALQRAGYGGQIRYEAAGFYPRGGGMAHLEVAGRAAAQPLYLEERGSLCALRAFVVTAHLPDHVAERGAAAIERYMKGVGRKAQIARRDTPSRDNSDSTSPGAAAVVTAECESGLAGFGSLGERGKPMERVAEGACGEFMAWWKSGAAVDEHLADQLVLPASLIAGESSWTTPKVTEHLRTVLWTASLFLSIDHTLNEVDGGCCQVRVRGCDPFAL